MYDVQLVAEHVIAYEYSLDHLPNNLRLQKLLYFIQAQFLFRKGEPCFEEDLEAWMFGPVVPSVYNRYKKYGSNAIPAPDMTNNAGIKPEDLAMIRGVVEQLRSHSDQNLLYMTRGQDPWIHAQNGIITKQSIVDFFKV
jgi:uncharacterized phage-associated protein